MSNEAVKKVPAGGFFRVEKMFQIHMCFKEPLQKSTI